MERIMKKSERLFGRRAEKEEVEAYLELETEFREDLIDFYRNQHSALHLSPLFEEDTPLLAFYTMPDINTVRIQRAFGGGREIRTPIPSFRSIFYKEDKLCNDIYVTGNVGLGKTAFCKRLVLTWCQAMNPIRDEGCYFLKEEIDTLAEFEFVFLLLLRESSAKVCDIDDMILSQIVSQLAHTSLDLRDLEIVLSESSCLVILDGLDEWTHQSTTCRQGWNAIPHRKARNWTILTTSRAWRFSVSGLKTSQVERRLDIPGLGQDSANALKRSVISHIFGEKDNYKLRKYVYDFNRALTEREMSDLESVPILLMYLLCFWCERADLGQSRCGVYSNVMELLLSRYISKGKDVLPVDDQDEADIPMCLRKQKHCRQFYTHFTALGQLAFRTLFAENGEKRTLVFISSVADKYLNEESLKFFFRTGILTQNKDQTKLTVQEKKVSFANRTVQEFFVALHMRSLPDQSTVPEVFMSKCKSVQDILEMSNILVFLSGLNADMSSLISLELMKIVNEDEVTQKYRSRLGESQPLKELQDMCVSCCKEVPQEHELGICLQDVFIDERCNEEQYRKNLRHLTRRNKQNIRSLSIETNDAPYDSAQDVIEYFKLNDLENIEKIHYQGRYNDRDILPLLSRSVKCLSLSCSDDAWSPLLYEKVSSLQRLEAIHIGWFDMSHSQLRLLCNHISERRCLREIKLWSLSCTDHGTSCPGFSVDLSRHSDVRKLILHEIPVFESNINTTSLEEGSLGLSHRNLMLRFINCVPADSKVNNFIFGGLASSTAIETMLDTLGMLVHVKDILLWNINLATRLLTLTPEMADIKLIQLVRVTMSALAVRGLVNAAQRFPRAVTVVLHDCNVTPEREFSTVKEKIRTSEHFRVLQDRENWFEFETINNAD